MYYNVIKYEFKKNVHVLLLHIFKNFLMGNATFKDKFVALILLYFFVIFTGDLH